MLDVFVGANSLTPAKVKTQPKKEVTAQAMYRCVSLWV